MLKYTWLLLDADGTLFDYDAAEAAAIAKTFRDIGLGFRERYAEVYRHINGRIWREFEQGEITAREIRTERFARLFREIGLEADPGTFGERYLANLGERADLIDGAEAVVRALHRVVGLVLITNGLQDVQRSRLSRSAIARYLHDVVISEEVGASKPDRRIFDAAFERMGGPGKEDVLIVGDSLTSDIVGGSDYGIDTCWFNPQGKACDLDVSICYEIGVLRELLTIVGTGP